MSHSNFEMLRNVQVAFNSRWSTRYPLVLIEVVLAVVNAALVALNVLLLGLSVGLFIVSITLFCWVWSLVGPAAERAGLRQGSNGVRKDMIDHVLNLVKDNINEPAVKAKKDTVADGGPAFEALTGPSLCPASSTVSSSPSIGVRDPTFEEAGGLAGAITDAARTGTPPPNTSTTDDVAITSSLTATDTLTSAQDGPDSRGEDQTTRARVSVSAHADRTMASPFAFAPLPARNPFGASSPSQPAHGGAKGPCVTDTTLPSSSSSTRPSEYRFFVENAAYAEEVRSGSRLPITALSIQSFEHARFDVESATSDAARAQIAKLDAGITGSEAESAKLSAELACSTSIIHSHSRTIVSSASSPAHK
ncbi:hypothetical protein V5O48_013668 [Marasmius crinis-equi]|uniref:Uncharacterized protein n=1 Tax=Marasmius crinis-equi TaxID=585013 RepID=A0ABR3EZU1_9AGAR